MLKNLVPSLWQWVCLTFISYSNPGFARDMEIQILHTNDLHSHFRSAPHQPHLGGYARLKTAIQLLRKESPNTLVVDAGDWSEGTIYYTEGFGIESLRLMDSVGIDVSVIGNHEWLNGPDLLLNVISKAKSSGLDLSLIGANVDLKDYSRADEFSRLIPPHVFKEVNGARIAFLGILTTEIIYEPYFKPVKITKPRKTLEKTVLYLKSQADILVAVSHNDIGFNEKLLKDFPDIDFVIGGHDHVLLKNPILVKRRETQTGWIVDAGFWGQYLGRMKLKFTQDKKLSLEKYDLLPIDEFYQEDPSVLNSIEEIEKRIEKERGPVFHDHIGDTDLELNSTGAESLLGDLVTDSYLDHATQVDASIDNINFMYSGLARGPIHTADVFNVIPAICHPETHESWHLSTIPIKGRKFFWFLNQLLSFSSYRKSGVLHTSGMELVIKEPEVARPISSPWDDWPSLPDGFDLLDPVTREAFKNGPIHLLKIKGEWIDMDKTYHFAVGGGILEMFKFVNSIIPHFFPTDQLTDLGIQSWKVLAQYVQKVAHIQEKNMNHGSRVRTLEPDLGMREGFLTSVVRSETTSERFLDIELKIKNYGLTFTPGKKESVQLYLTTPGNQPGNSVPLGQPQSIRSVSSGEFLKLIWSSVPISRTQLNGPHRLGVTAMISGNSSEINHTNDEITLWLTR